MTGQRRLNKRLGERVQKVEIGDRSVASPAALVQGEWGMSPTMQRRCVPAAVAMP